MNKYNSRKTEYMGIVFDSKAEAHRYQELLLLEKAGKIRDIELQPEYILIWPFVHQGVKYRGVKYRADFRYVELLKLNGVSSQGAVVEDVKGRRTPVYIIKKQLLLWKYPDINFVEVESSRSRR